MMTPRRNRVRRILAPLLGLALPVASGLAQAVLHGTVRDSTRNPVAGADISIGGLHAARADSGGAFRITVPAGEHALSIRAIGFIPADVRVRLANGENDAVVVVLARQQVQTLDPVDVRGARTRGLGLGAFEERRALGLGSFIDSTVLRNSEGRTLGDLLRQQRGVRILERGRAQYAMGTAYRCYASVMLDGQWFYRGKPGELPPDLRSEFMVMNLEAVEYYTSAVTPMEFQGHGGSCGVLVLWTRRGRR